MRFLSVACKQERRSTIGKASPWIAADCPQAGGPNERSRRAGGKPAAGAHAPVAAARPPGGGPAATRAAAGRGQTPRAEVSEQTLALANWALPITDVPRQRLSLGEALVLMRERWQMELLYKLWKQDGQVDEWHTDNPWRILCEVYAKLIGLLLQHWLIVLYAWQEPQRSLVKLAQVVRDTGWSLMGAGFARCLRLWPSSPVACARAAA